MAQLADASSRRTSLSLPLEFLEVLREHSVRYISNRLSMFSIAMKLTVSIECGDSSLAM